MQSLCMMLFIALASAFSPPAGSLAARRQAHASPRMMFGGGGGGDGEGNFMDKLKAAKDMFNPEMMKKYSEVGVKVQALQTELASTEVECTTADGSVTIKVSGTQAPAGVTVTDALCATGAEAASATLTQALKDAHMKSGTYAQEKMAGLYSEMGLTQGMAGLQ